MMVESHNKQLTIGGKVIMFPKKYAALAVGLLLVPTLAACGGETPAATPTAATTQATATSGTGATDQATATTGTTTTDATATTGGGGGDATATTGGGGSSSGQVFHWRAFAE